MHNCKIEIFCPEEYTKRNTDVKYSDVIKTTYYSTICEKDRPVNIVMPEGYSESIRCCICCMAFLELRTI